MRKTFVRKLAEFAAADPEIMLLTGDLGYNLFEPFAARFPEQFLNHGIMEQCMAGVAAGMALEGRTVFMYSIANFPTLRCLEQLRNDICYHNLNVKIVANGGGMAYGTLGISHFATEDLSVMRALPGMKVCAPGDPAEAAAVFDYARRTPGPVYIRLARDGEAPVHPAPLSAALPAVLPVREGDGEAVILCTGEILHAVLESAALLAGRGLNPTVCSLPVIDPLPEFDFSGARLLVTVEEHNLAGGFGGAVAEHLAASPRHPALLRLGLPDILPEEVGRQDYMRERHGLSPVAIADRVFAAWENASCRD